MLLGDVLLAFQWLGPLFIYSDCCANRIGKVGERGVLSNWHALEWAICGLMLGPLGLLVYLVRRRALISEAKQHPIVVSAFHKYGVLLLILLVAAPYKRLIELIELVGLLR